VKTPSHLRAIVLQPGEWWFGGGATRVRTVLGSCVAVTLWHPQRRIGGMCHYLLPSRGAAVLERGGDGRYGDEALAHLVREVRQAGSAPGEYEAKLFGGGRMFRIGMPSKDSDALQVPGRNVQAGRALLQRHGFACKAEHVGGYGHREVVLDLPDGQVWVRHSPLRDVLDTVSAFGVRG